MTAMLEEAYLLSHRVINSFPHMDELPTWAISLAPVLSAGNAYEVLENGNKGWRCKGKLTDRLTSDLSFLNFLSKCNKPVPFETTWKDRAIYVIHGTVCIYGHKLPDFVYMNDVDIQARHFNYLIDGFTKPEELLKVLLDIVK